MRGVFAIYYSTVNSKLFESLPGVAGTILPIAGATHDL